MLADLGALGHVAEPREVHVGARGDRDDGPRAERSRPARALQPGERERARRLEHRARVLEGVLDGGADLVEADGEAVVEVAPAELEGELADLPHGDAVGEHADVLAAARAGPSRSERVIASESSGWTPITRTSGRSSFTTAATPAASPPPPIGTKIARQVARRLAQDLETDRALPRDHVEVVVGRDRPSCPSRARASRSARAASV